MTVIIRSAIDFYERHPITAAIVLEKVKATRGHLDQLKPDDLFPFDQDHYGGLAANDRLAVRAGLSPGMAVADFCAGLGGPARYFAQRYGVSVTGIELTPARVRGATELTARVGLADRVHILEGDVTAPPLADASQDAVLSQEAFLHVPDLERTFRQARRVLKPGGAFAFTNWTVPAPLSEPDRQLMWDGMAVATLYPLSAQIEMLNKAGFIGVSTEDLTREWAAILVERLAMYQSLRGEAEAAGTPAGHDAFYRSYIRFVDLISTGGLGGACFVARAR